MKARTFTAAVILIVGLPVTAHNANAQSQTVWGDPDLQGVWNFATLIPFQRPDDAEGRAILSDEETATLRQQRLEQQDADRRDGGVARDVERAYNNFWWDYGDEIRGNRSSLVVDPGNGKLPPMTAAAQANMRERRAQAYNGPTRSWLDRSLWERCILGFNSGPPMVPSAYNNNFQLFQTAEHVVILNEMVHAARVVPLDGRAALSDNIRQWQGSSRGRWEGNTLVVETRNFRDEARTPYFRDSGEGTRLIERFTRVDPETLLYSFTIVDPTTYERYWTAEIPMKTGDGPMFEYACHEGNYGMFNLLAGARAEEAAEPTKESTARTK